VFFDISLGRYGEGTKLGRITMEVRIISEGRFARLGFDFGILAFGFAFGFGFAFTFPSAPWPQIRFPRHAVCVYSRSTFQPRLG
jgi:hypothetical protein